jgi:hypothetical protein
MGGDSKLTINITDTIEAMALVDAISTREGEDASSESSPATRRCGAFVSRDARTCSTGLRARWASDQNPGGGATATYVISPFTYAFWNQFGSQR